VSNLILGKARVKKTDFSVLESNQVNQKFIAVRPYMFIISCEPA